MCFKIYLKIKDTNAKFLNIANQELCRKINNIYSTNVSYIPLSKDVTKKPYLYISINLS